MYRFFSLVFLLYFLFSLCVCVSVVPFRIQKFTMHPPVFVEMRVYWNTPLLHSRVLFDVCLNSTDFNWNGNCTRIHTWTDWIHSGFTLGKIAWIFVCLVHGLLKNRVWTHLAEHWNLIAQITVCVWYTLYAMNSALEGMEPKQFHRKCSPFDVCVCVCMTFVFFLSNFFSLVPPVIVVTKPRTQIGRKICTPI